MLAAVAAAQACADGQLGATARLLFVGMVAVVTRVQWFDVKLLYTRSRATDGSTIARGLRGAIYRGGKGVKPGICMAHYAASICLAA